MIKVFSSSLLNNFDKDLVKKCNSAGYTAIVVECYDPSVPESVYWKNSLEPFVAVYPEREDKNGFPLIWDIVKTFPTTHGAGNNNQHGIGNKHPFTRGTCFQKIDGEWYATKLGDRLVNLSKTFGL